MRDTKRDKRAAEVGLEERSRLESLHRVSTSQAAFAFECLALRELHDIDAAFRRTLMEMLHLTALRGLEAEILELRPDGRLRLPYCVRLSLQNTADADLRVQREANTGNWLEPKPGDGLASYCMWFNLRSEERALAIANDIGASRDIELLVSERSEHRLTVYSPRRVADMFKPGRARRRGTLLVAPVYVPAREHEDARCIGVLNLNHAATHAFGPLDWMWAEACAARIGEAYATVIEHRRRLDQVVSAPRDARTLQEQTCLPNAKEITEVRRRLGKKQETVAEEAGLNVRTVRTAERGLVRVRRTTLAALAKVLNVNEQRLILDD